MSSLGPATNGDEPRMDRLPWLESADEDLRRGPSPLRVVALILLGLVIAGAVLTLVYNRKASSGPGGTGELIEASEGDYKVKPDEPGGMKVEGQGDSVFATSEGGTPAGTVDAGRIPEAPVTGQAAATKAPGGAGTARVVTEVPPSGGALAASAPTTAAAQAPAGGGGGAVIQLGSFPTEAGANSAWATASKRFGYLAQLGKSVEKADVGGRTVYRLRVNAGSAGNAGDLCGRLKVAGEACFIPK